MKKVIIGLSVAATLFMTNSYANDKGKGLFESKGCVICHKKAMDTIGPSLATIAASYAGREGTIIDYLKGDAEPIVMPERKAVMNPQLAKLETLFDDEIKSLAEYIISANDIGSVGTK